MSTLPQSETVQFQATPELKRVLEQEAARLNLTVGAFVQMLVSRTQAGIPAARFDRIVQEVFGRYGQTMRNLAK